MGKEKVVKKVIEWKSDFRRARGGYKKVTNPQLEEKIQNRKSWKRITKEAKTRKASE